MKTTNEYRRMLVKAALGAPVAASVPGLALADAPIRIRREWQQFKDTPQYQSFRNGMAAMRANRNPLDRGSLAYWANVHEHHCPHGAAYFVAWHRGYLYYFEQQLRIAANDPALNLPYWDYYAYATLPAEFTDPAPGNPLYLPRTGANVHAALDLAPFAPGVYNFQHGTPNAFEPKIEDVHNPIHDLIGGVMSTMQSPLDPIFYLHHASIDRLTHAWALPDGKGIPVSGFPYAPGNSDPYWAGNHVYAADLVIERYRTLDPTWLGIDYASATMPAALPPAPASGRAGADGEAPGATRRPLFRTFRPLPARRLSPTRRCLAGVAQPQFDEGSVSLRWRLDRRDAADVARAVAARRGGRQAGKEQGVVKVVFDRAAIAPGAGQGGFFYALYLNMPARIEGPAQRAQSFFGTLGAFQVAAASHHGPATLEFDITELLARQRRVDFSELSLSWLRVDGETPPAGRTIEVAQLRLDLSFAIQPAPTPPLPKPEGWYRRRP